MKLTAAILLMLIIFSSLFYYGYYNALVFHAKQEAREAIASNDAKHFKVIKVPIKIAAQNTDDEIWYGNELYDVAKRETIKDTVYEYLYHDSDEESVLSKISAFFKSNDDNFLPASPAMPLLKGVHKVPDQVYTFYSSVFVLKNSSTLPVLFSEKKYSVFTTIYEVPTPPPRAFYFLS